MLVRTTLVLLTITVSSLPIAAASCSSESPGGGGGSGGSAGSDAAVDTGMDAPGPQPAGASCQCDADCLGSAAHPGLCLHGLCVTRASAPCPGPNVPDGCDPGSSCFNSTTLGGNGVCLPQFDAATCTGGAQSRHGVCAPIKGKGCDPSTGQVCAVPTPPVGEPGSACQYDDDCTTTGASCYEGASDPSGWLEGYCLAFGCADSSACGEGACLPVATDGSGVCVQACGMDLDCRMGYWCAKTEDESATYCRAGCDAASGCPTGFTCVVDECIADDVGCSAQNPTGWCPGDTWCDAGVCSDEKFACAGKDDSFEDNDTRQAAKPAPNGKTAGLFSCDGDEDWYEVTVPKGKVLRVGIDFAHPAGDIDLVVYDAAGKLVGSRVGEEYPYNDRTAETGTEYYGLWSEAGGAKYTLRVIGHAGEENLYSLNVDAFDYQDGQVCTDLFSTQDCVGEAPNGAGLIPIPFPDPNATFAGNNYFWDTYSNYRFARRELMMLVRHALGETNLAFPGTGPLGLIDTCQKNGITPGYDVGDPRHPESTHDQGGNMDIAYFQTDGDNHAQIICGDGSVHADGYCSDAASTQHIVDLPRQAFFMAKLFASQRTRVIGVDKVIAPLLTQAAQQLAALPAGDPQKISPQEAMGFVNGMASGDGWPYHHHHIHLSLQWWGSQIAPEFGKSQLHPALAPHAAGRSLITTWPPRAQ